MGKQTHTALDTKHDYFANEDLTDREPKILTKLKDLGFNPKENIHRSVYYGTNKLGASHWLGTYKGQQVVAKIQGPKPNVSEYKMIESFREQSKSKTIRPPRIFYHSPWNKVDNCELFILEAATGGKVLQSCRLQPRPTIHEFLMYYLEYRKNCLPAKPWLPKPSKPKSCDESLKQLLQLAEKSHPNYPLRKSTDISLLEKANRKLFAFYSGVDMQFMHGHFSVEDLVYEKPGSPKIVLFSNLFWKWRMPFYDAVFGYAWFMLTMDHVEGISHSDFDWQRKIWLEEIYALPLLKSDLDKHLVDAALLERMIAAVVVDGMLMDPKKEISSYIFDSSRGEIERLIVNL